jgi:flagellar protein FliO/FliZ
MKIINTYITTCNITKQVCGKCIYIGTLKCALLVLIASLSTICCAEGNGAEQSNNVRTSTTVLSEPALASLTVPTNTTAPTPINSKLNSTTSNSSAQIANLIGGLALILLLIFGLSWFVKRFNQGGFTQNPAIKMLAAMPLGTRERLMLVEVGGKQILLGITPTQITNLQVFDEPVIVSKNKTPPDSSDFSQKLMAILQKNTANANPSDPNSSGSSGKNY